MTLAFSKYVGCGNDFILIDNRTLHYPQEATARLCHRQKGIGADGVILLENSQKADFRMRIFNADGSEAEMCGNGIRCLALFINEKITKKSTLLIETMHDIIPVRIKETSVEVDMPNPRNIALNITLDVDGRSLSAHSVDTGVPHCILFVKDVEKDADMSLAPFVRNHPKFSPKGSNVNFVEIVSKNSLNIRTYERGVEGETLACGTGAVASAVIAGLVNGLESPITVNTRSGEALKISFKNGKASSTEVKMEGSARKIFDGQINSLALGKDLI